MARWLLGRSVAMSDLLSRLSDQRFAFSRVGLHSNDHDILPLTTWQKWVVRTRRRDTVAAVRVVAVLLPSHIRFITSSVALCRFCVAVATFLHFTTTSLPLPAPVHYMTGTLSSR